MAQTLIRRRQLEDLLIDDTKLAGNISTAKLAEGALFLKKDGTVVMTADFNHGGFKAINMALPTASTDGATKGYVDSMAVGLEVKESCRAATVGANITLSGTQTIDGVVLIAGDRVLVKDQTTPSQNGIYVVSATGWSRSTDASTSAQVKSGMFTFIEEGTANDNSGWVLGTNGSITLNTTGLSFVQFSGTGSLSLLASDLIKTNGVLSLATVSDSGTGTFKKITVDTKGRVTGTTAVVQGDITALLGAGSITNAMLAVAYVQSVTGTVNVVSIGGSAVAPTITLLAGHGDIINPYGSKTANFVLAAPTGVAGVPVFRALVAADIPLLNQNTTGSAGSVTGTVSAVNGGTGQSTYAVGDILFASTTTALSRLADIATGNVLLSGGVNLAPSYGKVGLTTHISGTLGIGNGGTGQSTATAAFDALAPSQTGNGGKILTTNGTTVSWIANSPAVASKVVTGETPTGLINGTNPAFTLLQTSAGVGETVMVFLNGMYQTPGAANDYVRTSSTVFTFVTPPIAGDTVSVCYILP